MAALGDQPTKATIRRALGKEVNKPNAGRGPKSSKAPDMIAIAAMPSNVIEVAVTGEPDTSLIVHNWSSKAYRMMLGQHMGLEEERLREPKVPFDDFLGTLYKDRLTGEMQIRTIMFKAAMIEAVRLVDGVKPMDARQAFQIVGEFAPLYGQPTNRLDAVKVGMFPNVTTDLRFRAQFREWIAVLRFRFNPAMISKEAIVNLLEVAGRCVGVGDWRPMKSGVSGTFSTWKDGNAALVAELKRLRRWRLSDLNPKNTETEAILSEIGLDQKSFAELSTPPKPTRGANGSSNAAATPGS